MKIVVFSLTLFIIGIFLISNVYGHEKKSTIADFILEVEQSHSNPVVKKSAFPVINNDNQLVGMIMTDAISKIDRIKIENKKVNDIMIPVSELIVISPDKEVNDALKQLFRKGMSRIFIVIVDRQSQLIGLVSKSDILNLAQERKEYLQSSKNWNY